MGKLNKVLGNIRPKPKVVEIGGESFEFHQLTLADFVEIEKQTGVDLTTALVQAQKEGGAEKVFSSELINWVIYLSLKRGNSDLAKEISLGAAAEIATYGLTGEQLGEVLVWAIAGVSPSEAGDSGNAPKGSGG